MPTNVQINVPPSTGGLAGIVTVAVATSIIVIALGIIVYIQYSTDSGMLSGVGQLISAGATTITLIWLVVSQVIQTRQLSAQQKALIHDQNSLRTSIDSITAQLYLSLLSNAQLTLAKHCRSILMLCNACTSLTEIDYQVSKTGDHTLYVSKILNDAAICNFLESTNNPIISALIESYLEIHSEMKKIATLERLNIPLFQLTMKNSPYTQLYHFFSSVINLNQDPLAV